MAGTPWWAKISPDYYRGRPKDDDTDENQEPAPSALRDGTAARARKMGAILASTNLRDEPSVAGAFLNSDVPLSVAQGVDTNYNRVKNAARAKAAAAQGTPEVITREQLEIAQAEERQKVEQAGGLGAWGEVNSKIWGAVTAPLGPGRDILNAGIEEAKAIPVRLLEGMNAAWSVVSVPMAAGRSNQTGDATSAYRLNLLQRAQNGDAEARRLLDLAPVTGGDLADQMGQFPLTRGARTVLGSEPVTPGQALDMYRAGYDPTDFFSRYAWYYPAMEAGQRAVADSDVKYFSQQYNPQDVQASREIITSNVLNDGKFEALSASAQEFANRINSNDPQANELFERMNRSNTTQIGSIVADGLGLDRGTNSAAIVSAIGDLAIYWYADPVKGATRGITAYRNTVRGVPVSSIAASTEAKIVSVAEPGNLDSGPGTEFGRQMNNWLIQVDQMARQAAARGVHPNEILSDSAVAAERFRQLHPDLARHVELMLGARVGQVVKVRLKQPGEVAEELDRGTYTNPYQIEFAQPGTKPVWQLDYGVGGRPTNRSLNESRAAIWDMMGDFWWAEAWATGRPITNGIVLLPGEIAVNRAVRRAIAPIRDALVRPKASLYRALDARTGIVPLNGTASRLDDIVIGRAMGDWVAANYTGKWTKTLEQTLARIEMSPSNHKISFSGVGSAETYRRWVLQFFPRRLGYVMVNRWAMANPAQRKAQWDQTVEAIASAGRFRDTPEMRAFFDALTKGIRPVRPGQGRTPGPNELYTANVADNTIQADGSELAAALYPYQLSDTVTVPNMRWVRQQQQKAGLLSIVTGGFNSQIMSVPTQVWKVAKVATPSNTARQGIELVGMQWFEQGGAWQLFRARRSVSEATIRGRLARNDTARASYRVARGATAEESLRLQDALAAHDNARYGAELAAVATRLNLKPVERAALADLARDGIWLDTAITVATSGNRLPARLRTAAWTIDAARRVRLFVQEHTGAGNARTEITPDHHAWADGELIRGLDQASLEELGGSSAGYMALGGYRPYDDIAAAADKGLGGRAARIPNARRMLGVAGDNGAARWFREFDSRQTDDIGYWVMRAVAIEARNRGVSPAQVLNAERAAAGFPPLFPANVNTSEEVAQFLIRDHEIGARFRLQGERTMYNDDASGSLAVGPVQRAEAANRAGSAMTRDVSIHLGARTNPDGTLALRGNGLPSFAPEHHPMLDALVRGDRVDLVTLSNIPDRLRPKAVSTPMYVPQLGGSAGEGLATRIANRGTQLYGYVVAQPLNRLAIQPSFIANKNIAYRQMDQVFQELQARGVPRQQAAVLLEHVANRYAVNATFRYTDNVMERSVFSELVENFFMFQRAAEDFVRRFMRVTSANPAILSRAYLMMEAAQHSGLVFPHTDDRDDGTTETHLVFAFPGSELMAKGFQETGQALGWGDDLILKPLFSGMTSQVRWVNPSLSNPLGFSTSPMIGTPLRIVRWLFPETDRVVTDTLATIEGSNEPYFAEQGVLQAWFPGPINRLFPAAAVEIGHAFGGARDTNPYAIDGQLASSIRNAAIYYGAAGLLPPEGASPDQIEQANEAIIQMAMNQMVWRAVVGAFSPLSPQFAEPEDLGMPELNALDMAMGLSSIRSEWFDVLHDATEKYGSGAEGFSAANIEWLRRHPVGASILNPEAFKVGTTQNPGLAGEATNINSGQLITDWTAEHQDWIEKNRTVAYYLFPTFAEPSYSPAGIRQQLRSEIREHKMPSEMINDIRFQINSREFWQRTQARSAAIAAGGSVDRAWDAWDEWEAGWRATHPATSAEMDRRNDPAYVHAQLAPALKTLVESDEPVPFGVDKEAARRVWEHYNEYRDAYNQMDISSSQTKYDRARLNAEYRRSGNAMFLGTSAQELWRAMDVYEVE